VPGQYKQTSPVVSVIPEESNPMPKKYFQLPLVLMLVLALIPLSNTTTYAAAPSPKTAVGGNQGLQFGAVIDDNGQILLTDQMLDYLAASKAGWIKINFRLGKFIDWTETSTFGYSALSLYDQIVTKARQRGLKVLGLLSNEAWQGWLSMWQENNNEVSGGVGSNTYLSQFAKYAAVLLAQHYAGQVDNWEVWNEPSQPLTYLYPSNFAWLLADVYQEVKKAGVTTARFTSGGITAQEDSAGKLTSASTGADYLQQTYNQGKNLAGWNTLKSTYGSYPLDSIGQHIYVDSWTTTSSIKIKTALDFLHNAYVKAEGGSTNKQTVITEVGWASDHVGDSVQATNLRIAYTQFKKTSYVKNAYWFFLRDEPPASLYLGLLKADNSYKPSWNAYLTYANF
jgi:hypothetical protein